MERSTFFTEEELKKAMDYIDEYVWSEFEQGVDFEDLKRVPVAYTELGEENEYPVQVYYDLVKGRCLTEIIDDDDYDTRLYVIEYKESEALLSELECLDFCAAVFWWYDSEEEHPIRDAKLVEERYADFDDRRAYMLINVTAEEVK